MQAPDETKSVADLELAEGSLGVSGFEREEGNLAEEGRGQRGFSLKEGKKNRKTVSTDGNEIRSSVCKKEASLEPCSGARVKIRGVERK